MTLPAAYAYPMVWCRQSMPMLIDYSENPLNLCPKENHEISIGLNSSNVQTKIDYHLRCAQLYGVERFLFITSVTSSGTPK